MAKLYLRDLRMQTFMYKAAGTWGPSFQCSATGKWADFHIQFYGPMLY